jgi:hypothetical protein
MRTSLTAALVLLIVPLVSAQCDVYNSSVNIEKNDFGAFMQDRIGCGLQNLMAPGALDTVLILGFILLVMVVIYGLMKTR